MDDYILDPRLSELMPVICLDTSAVNALLDDDDSQRLTDLISDGFTTYVTAMNVIEIGATKNPERREKLRRLLHELGQDYRPLELPNHLLRNICRIHQEGREDLVATVGEEGEGLYLALTVPGAIGEEERDELLRWAQELEEGMKESAADLKSRLDRLFVARPDQRPKTAGAYVKSLQKDPWVKYEFVSKVYKRETRRVLPLSQLDGFLRADVAVWPIWMTAYVYHAFYRAAWDVKSHPPGRNKVGIADLWALAYLPFCDLFVTNDLRHGGQFNAARFVNVFNGRGTMIRRWSEFRSTLIEKEE